jgi:hypothetical protein
LKFLASFRCLRNAGDKESLFAPFPPVQILNAVGPTIMVWRAAVFRWVVPVLPLLTSLPFVQIRFLLFSIFGFSAISLFKIRFVASV